MKHSLSETAALIGRALLSASNHSRPTGTWSRSLEQALHQLSCRDLLTPSLVARVIDTYLVYHPSLSLGFFNWASQQPKFSHSSVTYQSVLKSLSLSRQFNALEKLLKDAKSQRILIDPLIYRSIIASRVKEKKSHEAFLVLNGNISLIHEIGAETCNSLLAGLTSEGYVDYAGKMFDAMVERGTDFSTLGLGLFLRMHCRDAELDKVLGLIDNVKMDTAMTNGSVVAILVIHGLCKVGRVSEAFSALEKLRDRNCKPDFMAYRIVAEAFRSMGCAPEEQAVLKKKRKLGVAPRAGDYRDFIFVLLAERRIQEAKELGEVIVDGNFPIEDDVLDALVGSVSTIDPCSALMFFKFMIEKERTPTLHTLRSLSQSLCKCEKIEELMEVFRYLSTKGYFTNLERYNTMVSFLCLAGKVREAYEVFQDMKKKGLSPDVSSYNILMEACCREDLLRPAKKLWDEMFSCGVHGNSKTYNILIVKFSEVGQTEEAQRLFCHMLENGIAPDATTYKCLLENLCQDAKIEAAIHIFHKAVDQDMELAQMILAPFVLHLCKGGHYLSASKFLCDLSCDIRSSESHAILLKCLAEAGQIQMAVGHSKRVIDASPSLFKEILTKLLAMLSSSSNSGPILQLLQEVKRSHFTTYNDPYNEVWNMLSICV